VTSGGDLAQHRLARAWETFEEAKLMAESGHWNGCVNRLYYACFYVVSALLLSRNLSSSKHTGVRSLFSIHFVQQGLFPKELAALYNTLFDSRQESDYEDFFRIDPEEVLQWLSQAERFIRTAAELLE
jgi:uncharacterized protein (UPF0332 family)